MEITSMIGTAITALGAGADIHSLAPLFSSPMRKAVETTKRHFSTDVTMQDALDAARKSGELNYYAFAIVHGHTVEVDGLADILLAQLGRQGEPARVQSGDAAHRFLRALEFELLEDDATRVIAAIVRQQGAQLQAMIGQVLAEVGKLQQQIDQQTDRSESERERISEAKARLRERLEGTVQALNEDRVEDAIQGVERTMEDLDLLHAFLPDDRYFRQSAFLLQAQVYSARGQWAERDGAIQGLCNGPPLDERLVGEAAQLAAASENEAWLSELLPRLIEDQEERTFAVAALHWLRRDAEETLGAIPDDTENPDLLYMKAQALTYRLAEGDPEAAAALLERIDELEGLHFRDVLTGRLGTHLLKRVVGEHLEAPGLDRERLVAMTRERLDRAIAAYEPVADQHPVGYLQALTEKMLFLNELSEYLEAKRLSDRVNDLQPEDLPVVAVELSMLVEDESLIDRLEEEGNESRSRIATARGVRAYKIWEVREAEAYFRVALREAEGAFDYTPALHHLAHLYFDTDHEAAAELLAQEHPLAHTDDLAYLDVQLTYATDGLDAALDRVNERLGELPRSLPLLRLKYDLLEMRRDELLELRQQGDWVGRELILTYEAMEDATQQAFSLLPCPKHKVQRAAAVYNLGRKEEARRLVRAATEEGLSADELPVNIHGTTPL